MPNEYHPWVETDETELAYFRRRFLEESARAERLESVGTSLVLAGNRLTDETENPAAWIEAVGRWRTVMGDAAGAPAAPPESQDPYAGMGTTFPGELRRAIALATAAPPPPSLPPEVQRVLDAAEERFEAGMVMATGPDDVLRAVETWSRAGQRLDLAVAALRARKEEQGG